MEFTLTSKSFEYGAKIPIVHTCDGDDISPELSWEGEPDNTAFFALIMEDPDAPGGTFTHWIMYNIPADCHHLDKTIPIQKNLDNGAIQGKNDFGKIGYRGPCPPPHSDHHYWFRIFAMKKKLPPESVNSGKEFYKALNGLSLDRAEYMGVYKRD